MSDLVGSSWRALLVHLLLFSSAFLADQPVYARAVLTHCRRPAAGHRHGAGRRGLCHPHHAALPLCAVRCSLLVVASICILASLSLFALLLVMLHSLTPCSKGDDLHAYITLTLAEAMLGFEKTIQVQESVFSCWTLSSC